MGWRGQEACEDDERARLRALPWHRPYNWFGFPTFALAAFYVWANVAHA